MIKKYKYRFKTRIELINEFGSEWEYICDMDDAGQMNYLLGTDVDVPYESLSRNGDVYCCFKIVDKISRMSGFISGWMINKLLIKKKPKIPTYNRKKLVYE